MSRAEFLRSVELFRGLGPDQIGKLEAVMRPVEYQEGEVIFNERSEGQHVFVIESGVVEIFRAGEGEDRSTRLARLAAGEIFGELSILDGKPRAASARAAIDPVARLLVISKRDFDRVLHENPALAAILLRAIVVKVADRLRRLDDAVHHLSRAMAYGSY